jgi:hypothetical protein
MEIIPAASEVPGQPYIIVGKLYLVHDQIMFNFNHDDEFNHLEEKLIFVKVWFENVDS